MTPPAARVVRPAASRDDVLAGLAVRHGAYRREMPLATYQAARLAAPKEHRATSWLVEDDGRAVATLVCHPLTFGLGGRTIPGYGLGSVGTLDAHRRRGHASALCRAACEAMEREGRPVGLLFASVAPAFYERLSFSTSPAWGHECDRLTELAASGPVADLVPVDPYAEADRLAAAYERFHAGELHLRRDAADVVASETDNRTWWFAAGGLDRGYLRLVADETTLEVLEPILLDAADEAPALRAVARLATAAGKRAVTGWLEPTPFVREWFAAAPRDDSLPMLRGAPPHDRARFWGSDHF